MKVIVGLGNPGNEYKYTRHNAGFLVIDEICKNRKVSFKKGKFADCVYARIKLGGETVYLVKPLTYMNLSGKAVLAVKKWFKMNLEDLLVVCDDVDLCAGSVRFRAAGSSGGHNGLESITEALQTKNFTRLKIGIGRPSGKEALEDYVLNPINKRQMAVFLSSVSMAAGAVIFWIDAGTQAAMNEFNGCKCL